MPTTQDQEESANPDPNSMKPTICAPTRKAPAKDGADADEEGSHASVSQAAMSRPRLRNVGVNVGGGPHLKLPTSL